MRLRSTVNSSEAGEVTALALVETLFAIAIAVYTAAALGSVAWLTVSVCLAPLLLLRTDESSEISLRLFNRYYLWIEDHVHISLLFIAAALGAFGVRVFAVVLTLIRHPAASFAAIPRNWARVSLCLDAFTPPELVPGYERGGIEPDLKPLGLLASVRLEIQSAPSPAWRIAVIFFGGTVFDYAISAAAGM